MNELNFHFQSRRNMNIESRLLNFNIIEDTFYNFQQFYYNYYYIIFLLVYVPLPT
jgi:hypothetical protein